MHPDEVYLRETFVEKVVVQNVYWTQQDVY